MKRERTATQLQEALAKGVGSKHYDRPSTMPKDDHGQAVNPDRRLRRAVRKLEGKNGRLQSPRQAKKDRRRRRDERAASDVRDLFTRGGSDGVRTPAANHD